MSIDLLAQERLKAIRRKREKAKALQKEIDAIRANLAPLHHDNPMYVIMAPRLTQLTKELDQYL